MEEWDMGEEFFLARSETHMRRRSRRRKTEGGAGVGHVFSLLLFFSFSVRPPSRPVYQTCYTGGLGGDSLEFCVVCCYTGGLPEVLFMCRVVISG